MTEQPKKSVPGVAGQPQTYDDIINDAWLSEDERKRAMADSLLGHMAALAFQRGNAPYVNLLLQVRNSEMSTMTKVKRMTCGWSFLRAATRKYQEKHNKASRRFSIG